MKTKTPKKPTPMPEFPNRAEDGVVVCAVLEGTKIRLVFDDVHSRDRAFPQRWKTSWFFTETTFDAHAFEECELTDEELANIGMAVVARLGALNKRRRADRESAPDDPLKL